MPSTTTPLPTARQFVTQLLNSLSPPAEVVAGPAATNPLQNVTEDVKKQLLSLQVLFPNEFVPALDLLDRRLVTRFCICEDEGGQQQDVIANPLQQAAQPRPQYDTMTDIHPGPETTETHPRPPAISETTTPKPPHPHTNNTIYYVRSAQARPSRFSTSYDTTSSYEVRLTAWNCSCPAFTFAAFPASCNPPASPTTLSHSALLTELENVTEAKGRRGERWEFGGVSNDQGMPPVCKHLLACVLVERCKGVFGGFVEEKVVGVEEAAGWAAWWGD